MQLISVAANCAANITRAGASVALAYLMAAGTSASEIVNVTTTYLTGSPYFPGAHPHTTSWSSQNPEREICLSPSTSGLYSEIIDSTTHARKYRLASISACNRGFNDSHANIQSTYLFEMKVEIQADSTNDHWVLEINPSLRGTMRIVSDSGDYATADISALSGAITSGHQLDSGGLTTDDTPLLTNQTSSSTSPSREIDTSAVGYVRGNGTAVVRFQFHCQTELTSPGNILVGGDAAGVLLGTTIQATNIQAGLYANGASSNPNHGLFVEFDLTDFVENPDPVSVSDITVCSDANLNLSVNSPQLGLTYNWYKFESYIPPLGTGTNPSFLGSGGTITLPPNPTQGRTGYYYLDIVGPFGHTESNVFHVQNVSPIELIVSPSDFSGCMGDSHTLSLGRRGGPLTSVIWRRNGAVIPGPLFGVLANDCLAGASNCGTYGLYELEVSQSGVYTILLETACETMLLTAIVNFHSMPVISGGSPLPQFCVGEDVELEVFATGSSPTSLQYRWSLPGQVPPTLVTSSSSIDLGPATASMNGAICGVEVIDLAAGAGQCEAYFQFAPLGVEVVPEVLYWTPPALSVGTFAFSDPTNWDACSTPQMEAVLSRSNVPASTNTALVDVLIDPFSKMRIKASSGRQIVRIQSAGELSLDSDIDIESGGTLFMDGGSINTLGKVTIAEEGRLTGNGNLAQATSILNHGYLATTSGTLRLEAATFKNMPSGEIDISGSGQSLEVLSDTFTNDGTISALAGSEASFSSAVNNHGTLKVQSDSFVETGQFTNHEYPNITLVDRGGIQLDRGTLRTTSDSAILNECGALIEGHGTIVGSVDNKSRINVPTPIPGGPSSLTITGNLENLSTALCSPSTGPVVQIESGAFLYIKGSYSGTMNTTLSSTGCTDIDGACLVSSDPAILRVDGHIQILEGASLDGGTGEIQVSGNFHINGTDHHTIDLRRSGVRLQGSSFFGYQEFEIFGHDHGPQEHFGISQFNAIGNLEIPANGSAVRLVDHVQNSGPGEQDILYVGELTVGGQSWLDIAGFSVRVGTLNLMPGSNISLGATGKIYYNELSGFDPCNPESEVIITAIECGQIQQSPAPDCDANGVPDSVAITSGSSLDCNENLIPDECELALGFSYDTNGNGVPDECDSLSVDRLSVSLADGGTQTLSLRAGPEFGSHLYFVLGSVTGTSPGILGVPVNVDEYFNLTLTQPNFGVLGTTLGVLDASGEGEATINIPPGFDSSLAGLRLYHAFAAIGFGPATVAMASNYVFLDLVD